ncbi:MAG TPA: hypothetical protein VF134_04350 [Candidatus Dormibacteraeota bacterium]
MAVLLGLHLLGCQSAPAARTPAATIARTNSPQPATEPAPSATPSPTPTPTPLPALAGNFDGGGPDEAVTLSGSGKSTSITYTLESGQQLTSSLAALLPPCGARSDADTIYQPRILGVGDFRGDGRSEALIELYRGASTQFPVVVGIDRGSVETATVIDGANACQRIFPIAGSVTHGNGFACAVVAGRPGFQVLQAGLPNPAKATAYDWYRADYQWQGLNLHLVGLEHRTYPVPAAGGMAPPLAAAWQVHCQGLPAWVA